MTDELKQRILDKQGVVRSDAFQAKKGFDSAKSSLDDCHTYDDDHAYPEVNDLRHEIKLMMTLMSESKFDDIVHLISNPSRLMGLNFLIGFLRGLGFTVALLVMAIVIMVSLSDTVLF